MRRSGSIVTLRSVEVVSVVALAGVTLQCAGTQPVVRDRGDQDQGELIRLDERDAVVWSPEQVVRGWVRSAEPPATVPATLYVNGEATAFTASGDFAVPVRLHDRPGDGATTLVACVEANGDEVCSAPVRWRLGYRLRPEVSLHATVEGRTVTLHGRVLDNPDDAALAYGWRQDPDNPRTLELSVHGDHRATVVLPEDAPRGEYSFDWRVTAADGDASRARTFVTVDAGGVRPFDIESDHAAWVDRAMIYEVTPYAFAEGGRLADITARIPELVELGVNTLWLQPIFATTDPGQGYHVIDYFAVRSDLGTEDDLRRLVDMAHDHGMKVLLDFVPNHTSLQHPYAQDAIAHGEASHYADFYQRAPSGARYSRHEHVRREGQMDFVYYFWPELVNLDHDNPEVQRWMIEAGRYWIERLDIDGYRIDAVWGVNARTPEAMQRWRLALKRLAPKILLLGEDKATLPASFEARFDAAYDWYPEESWVSRWTWQTHYSPDSNPTIFNSADVSRRAQLLHDALTNRGLGFHPDAKVLRFMENNDTFRFIATHGPRAVERTRMAATLLYSLPGIPLLYNGQEIGFAEHPYHTERIFARGQSIQSQDRRGLFPLYQRLLDLRASHPALYSDHFAEVDVGPAGVDGHVYAYRRWHGDEDLFAVVNLAGARAAVELDLPVEALDLEAGATYALTDLVTGHCVSGRPEELDELALTLPGYGARLYLVGDRCITVAPAW